MIFDINTFRSNIHGFQKLEHYRVRFAYPPLLNLILPTAKQIDSKLEFYTDTAYFPGVALMTRPISRYGYGHTEMKPIAAQFNQCIMTFYADQNADNITFFQSWMSAIVNFNLSGGINPTKIGRAHV